MDVCWNPHIKRKWSPPHSLRSTETRHWAKTKTQISVQVWSSMVSQTRVWCQSWELAHQLTQQIHDRKPVIQPLWWNKETQAAWTDNMTMLKPWHKERSKPHPDLTFKAHMEEKTDVSRRVAGEAKASVTLSTETLQALTSGNSTNRLRAVLQTPTPPAS